MSNPFFGARDVAETSLRSAGGRIIKVISSECLTVETKIIKLLVSTSLE
jgi:hypothetical protein